MPSGELPTTKVHPKTKVRLTILKSTSDILVSLVPASGVKLRAVRRSDVGRIIGPLLDSIANTLKGVMKNTQVPAMRHHHREKLTAEQVRSIRASTDPLKCIADEFGISIGSASEIRNFRYYRWVK